MLTTEVREKLVCIFSFFILRISNVWDKRQSYRDHCSERNNYKRWLIHDAGLHHYFCQHSIWNILETLAS